ncbi:hypothetical protein [Arenibaculum sp.]|jgi:hypothetical protein|uniref:hypothetical protein n=1 Tax=Arenibaculum sp. TaxID=2865862 RepID=UPI002E1449A4|nr:hypothetical protein [Arenibaculum sp.]
MSVNAFTLYPALLSALEVSLSPERMATYIAAAGGDREKAIRLYTWNTAVSAAFYGPLQGLEVAVRNAMHRQISATYGPNWYDNPQCRLDAGALNRVAGAKADLGREGYPVDPPHVVAALAFGFWVSLLGRGGYMADARATRANYEMSLWRPALHRAFPHVRKSRADVHRPLDYLRTFRNRIAHHEPIFGRHLVADYASILEVAGWICPSTRDWIAYHSRVPEILAQPRDGNNLRF